MVYLRPAGALTVFRICFNSGVYVPRTAGDAVHIQAIMTTFNRRAVTLRCIARILDCDLPPEYSINILVADAGSSDGTRAAIDAQFANRGVRTVSISSANYWAQGMRLAWEAVQESAYDYILWINDDIVPDVDAITRLLEVAASGAVAVGAMRDPSTGLVTYAGFARNSWRRPLYMAPVQPAADRSVSCAAINGNLVLIPRRVDESLGGFPRGYVHGLADYAYGLEAVKRRHAVELAAGTVGTCERNPVTGSWADPTLSARERWRLLRSPKGLPARQWFGFARRYGGPFGVVAAARPYATLMLRVIWERIASSRSRMGGLM